MRRNTRRLIAIMSTLAQSAGDRWSRRTEELYSVRPAGLANASGFLLWPTEPKRLAFQELHRAWKARMDEMNALRPKAAQAREEYKGLQSQLVLCDRLDDARQQRDRLAALLSSVKYQL